MSLLLPDLPNSRREQGRGQEQLRGRPGSDAGLVIVHVVERDPRRARDANLLGERPDLLPRVLLKLLLGLHTSVTRKPLSVSAPQWKRQPDGAAPPGSYSINFATSSYCSSVPPSNSRSTATAICSILSAIRLRRPDPMAFVRSSRAGSEEARKAARRQEAPLPLWAVGEASETPLAAPWGRFAWPSPLPTRPRKGSPAVGHRW